MIHLISQRLRSVGTTQDDMGSVRSGGRGGVQAVCAGGCCPCQGRA